MTRACHVHMVDLTRFQLLLSVYLDFQSSGAMNAKTDKLVRRTTIIATVTASYFLLTADYGPEPNALDPIKKAIQSGEDYVKGFIFGKKRKPEGGDGKLGSNKD